MMERTLETRARIGRSDEKVYRPSGWRQPADRRLASECAVTDHLSEGPLGLQGAVQSFDLAVLPWAVRFDELLTDAVLGADRTQ